MNLKKYLTIIAAGGFIAANASDVPVIKAEQIAARAVKIDGVLNEEVWKKAPSYTNFTHLNASQKKASEQTFFQVAVSSEGFYWAFRCPDKSIKAQTVQRDGAVWHDDSLEIFMSADDPLPDDPNVRRGRHFLFNPLATRYDDTFTAGISSNKWNSDWKAAVRKDANGFTAEVFIPFYAFELDQAKTRWRFNVGRENYTGEDLAVSVFSPANTFMQMEKFAILEVPAVDKARFSSRVNGLKLETRPTAGGISQQLSGRLANARPGVVTLQAVARQDGKIKAFNRCDVNVPGNGSAEFAIPFDLEKSGVYDVELTIRDDKGKVFYTEQPLAIELVPFTLKLEKPAYRKTIFANQRDKEIVLCANFNADAELLKKAKTTLTVTDQSHKVLETITLPAAGTVRFSLNGTKYVPGDYCLTVKTSGVPSLTGVLAETITIAEPQVSGGNTVYLGKAREVLLNDQPFFPRGFMGGSYEPELFSLLEKSGFNFLHFYVLHRLPMERIRQVLDQAQKYNLKVIMYPYHQTGIGFFGFSEGGKRNQPRLSDAAWERLRKMVNEVRKHPAFFAWYLYDEPRGADFCAELRKVAALLQKLDPHHPVMGADCSADGCITKAEGYGDIHILDLYPHPMTDGTFSRSISSVMGSMKMVSENIGSCGAWFCPEAFTPLNDKYRTISYREIRAIIFGSIVNGATGISPYKIGNPASTYYTTEVNPGIFYHPDMHLGYLEGIGPELKALDKVLALPDRVPVKCNNNAMLLMRKLCNGKNFIIAVNPTGKTLNVKFTIPGFSGKTLRVFNEKRSVKVAGGAFADCFEPYAAHIYTDCTAIKDTVNVTELENKIRLIDKNLKK